MRWIAFVLLLAMPGLAQSPATRPVFEVASLKLNTHCGNGGRVANAPTPGRLTLSCVPLRTLIQTSYGTLNGSSLRARPLEILGGPGWIDSDLYDLNAKAEGNAPVTEMLGPMLQSLLEERCQLKVRKESKEVPVYALAVGKDGAKLQPAKAGSCIQPDLNNLRARPGPGEPVPHYCGFGSMRMKDGVTVADWYGVSLSDFAGRMVATTVDRPVIDKTGLAGTFDIHLEYVRDFASSGPVRLNGVERPDLAVPATDAAGPSIFVALQKQLGLKLSPDKGAVETLVIDRVEKPSEN